jgi:hypothetical protein
MTNRERFMVAAILAATTACSDMTAPKQVGSGDVSLARSGTFRLVKNCSSYQGQGGQSCTVTSATLNQIRAGSTITYTSGVGADGILVTDITLDAADQGISVAYGHCTVNLRFNTPEYGTGACELTGGTGKLKGIHTETRVGPLLPFADLNFEWVGSYSFRE